MFFWLCDRLPCSAASCPVGCFVNGHRLSKGVKANKAHAIFAYALENYTNHLHQGSLRMQQASHQIWHTHCFRWPMAVQQRSRPHARRSVLVLASLFVLLVVV